MMQIGILGSGEVGQKLADGFIAIGVHCQDRHAQPGKSRVVGSKARRLRVYRLLFGRGDVWKNHSACDILGRDTKRVAVGGVKNCSSKVVIDVTNPLDFSNDVHPRLAIDNDDSSGETVQILLPKAKLVQTFNIVGNTHMFRPDIPGRQPIMFICGGDERAKKVTTEIRRDWGRLSTSVVLKSRACWSHSRCCG